MNDALEVLNEVFPHVPIKVFREMLANVSEESRLHVVADALVNHNAMRGEGRLKAVEQEDAEKGILDDRGKAQHRSSQIPPDQRFRSRAYKDAVARQLYREFRAFSRSTIDRVLAEHNHSYAVAQTVLHQISSRSWWSTISSVLFRRRPRQACDGYDHPLVKWVPGDPSSGHGHVPKLKETSSTEFNEEIRQSIFIPLQQQLRQIQVEQDRLSAMELIEAEAEADQENAMFECQCCFASTTFERLASCDDGDHLVCFVCIRHAISEAVFGQSWGTSVNAQRGTLRCLAPSLGSDSEGCDGCIQWEFISRALSEDRSGEKLLRQLEQKIIVEGLKGSNVSLVGCPFCPYAEVDDCQPGIMQCLWLRANIILSTWTVPMIALGSALLPLLLPIALVMFVVLMYVLATRSEELNDAITRAEGKRRGLRFTCLSPCCGRRSCRACGKEWHDIHVCYESERVALREHIERAMVEAVKRTCPRCNLSFVKASGCNKLTCPCGYSMCYVCRNEISRDGYRHFCEHFRPLAQGSCAACTKCDLYRSEDEDIVVARAAEDAERAWRAQHGDAEFIEVDRCWEEHVGLQRTCNGRYERRNRGIWVHIFSGMAFRCWPDVLDTVVERIIRL